MEGAAGGNLLCQIRRWGIRDRRHELVLKAQKFRTMCCKIGKYSIYCRRDFQITREHFQVPYLERFQEGEFRKRVQFMYGGRLQTIRFQYTGPSIEAVLDRLPTAEIEEQTENGWIVKAEVFGKGIEMWIRSQGEYVTLL